MQTTRGNSCKNKYPNITLVPLSNFLWMPLSKPNWKKEGKKSLEIVLHKGDCTKSRLENKQVPILIDSSCLKHRVEKDSVISFNLIRTHKHERHMPIMRMGWGSVSMCAHESYVCNKHGMEEWHVCHVFQPWTMKTFTLLVCLNGKWPYQQWIKKIQENKFGSGNDKFSLGMLTLKCVDSEILKDHL